MNAHVTQVPSEVSIRNKNPNIILLLGGFAHWSIIKAVYGILQLYIRFKNF